MMSTDTIVALATPFGRGGVGVLRISGPLTVNVASEVLGKVPQPRKAEYLSFYDNTNFVLDRGIALFFLRPHSFTGEDVLELHCHGSPVILDMLLQRIILISGIRIANPGEFSERAFLNGKIDLVQAESIADLINSSSVSAARSAINSLQGFFSKQVNKLTQSLIKLRVFIEANIDFPDENINFKYNENIKFKLEEIINYANKLCKKTHQGNLLREGVKVVIVGKPNVGKSSLFNVLINKDSAIVTNIPGTTRDVLHEQINLNGVSFNIFDTAGLHDTQEKIELIGINRTWQKIKEADHILLVIDDISNYIENSNISSICPDFFNKLPSSKIPITVVLNKSDLTGDVVSINKNCVYPIIVLSTKTRKGIDLLLNHLKQTIGFTINNNNQFLARRRHLFSLKCVINHLEKGKKILEDQNYLELLAEEVRLAQLSLDEITGKFSSVELLKKIFSEFCIGK